MARDRAVGAHEGTRSLLLTDVLKDVCDFCGGTHFMFSLTTDSNTDLSDRANEKLRAGTCTGGVIECIVLQCVQCGTEQGRVVWILDTCAACATPALTMTHLDGIATGAGGYGINGLAGYELIPLGGGDIGESFTIVSNTVGTPTIITVDSAINDNTATELCLITRFKQQTNG